MSLETEVEGAEDIEIRKSKNNNYPDDLDANEDSNMLGFKNHLSFGLFDEGDNEDDGWPK